VDYDHHDKAGNQGDVVKHVAVVAALESLDAKPEDAPFWYADTFAGYAHNPLCEDASSVDGWKAGIGRLMAFRDRFRNNRHVKLWSERYLGDDLGGRSYPGSSLIASDVFVGKRRPVRLSLWDTSLRAVKDLRKEFDPRANDIFRRAAKWTEEAVRRADFLLIDPPGLRSRQRPEYPSWSDLAGFLKNRPAHQSVLLWLPVKAVTTSKPPGEDAASWDARNDAQRWGFRGVRVRWATGGRTIGCQLIYHLPDAAARALTDAVKCVVKIARWQVALPLGVKAISARRPALNDA
jgi:23S rRNA A2030 N6-methylase RlmJ